MTSIMAKDFIKFIEKHPLREKFLDILEAIYYNILASYDIKPLTWYKWVFRIRVGDIRFIFEKTINWNVVHYIGNRWDIYKKI